jgi:putative transcriptional regulator
MHHLDDATIMGLAAGSLPTAIGIVASAHIEMCQSCQDRLKFAEGIGGAVLEGSDATPLSVGAFNNVLEKIEAGDRNEVVHHASFRHDPKQLIPSGIARLLNGDIDSIKWKRVGKGVKTFQIEMERDDDGKLFMMHIEAGRAMPEHGHSGSELTLVLSGSYTDKCGSYQRGDVADLDEDVEHQPIVDSKESCICVVAVERPTRFKGIVPRLLQPLIGI